jgi:hypothetical protein
MLNVRARTALAAVLGLVCLCRAGIAESFPPVTDAERALTAVPGDLNAPAVILFKNAELQVTGYGGRRDLSSRLIVRVRTKILTEEGARRWGDLSIPHSGFSRLESFEGRTVLPDGTVVPLPADAKFQRKVSEARKTYVTVAAFPAVRPGAVLDYRYELLLKSAFFFEPWYFADEVPVLHSEITYKIPKFRQASTWRRDPFGIGLRKTDTVTFEGVEERVWADDVPAVRRVPYGPPFSDLALQMTVVPIFYDPVEKSNVLDSWPSVCKLFSQVYEKAQRNDRGAARAAAAVAPRGTPREKAETLYRFVRDQIATLEPEGVAFDDDSSVRKTMADKQGSSAEKALLLQWLLRQAGIESRLVWAADRRHGLVDLKLPSPLWFDRVLVQVSLDGPPTYLDPADRALGFGQITPWYEGMPALIVDERKPEEILLPETSFDQSARKAILDLSLDSAGRLAGSGELILTGHHAWESMHGKEDGAKAAESWKDWLGDQFKGFKVGDVTVEESPEERRVRIAWSLRQGEDDLLGDESAVAPSRPLGPVVQPFVEAAKARNAPVLFPYAGRDEVELRLRWPEGWTLEQIPQLVHQENSFAALTVTVGSIDAARLLTYHRRLDLRQKQLVSLRQYAAVQALYAAAEKSDAQPISLVRR